MVKVEDIKALREETGAGIADIKQALEEAGNTAKNPAKVLDIARELIKQKGVDKAAKKADREVKTGLVDVYSHNGKVGVAVEVLCETDFVARTEDFKNLVHELALQIASMDPQSKEELLAQEYIRDSSLTIEQLVKSVIGKLGENIQIGKFCRVSLG